MVKLEQLLARKTWREFIKMLGPALALSGVMAVGLASLIMSQGNLKSLLRSQKLTYQNLNFADALVPLVRIPRTTVHFLQNIEGVQRIECRLTESGQVQLPREERQISARFHSLPGMGSLNNLKLVEGRWPKANALNEVILSDAFARAWNLHSGDSIRVTIKGQGFHFYVSGLGRSAEYIYQTGSAVSIPDDKLFSVWWIHPRILEKTSNLQSSCNELLVKGTSARQLELAWPELERRLKPFGFTQYIPRARQLSHYFLNSELEQLKAMSIYMPGIFIAVCLFLLNITMNRVLMTQRETIATLRAFGFQRVILAIQSVGLSLACLLPGAAAGIILGVWLSKKMFAIYVLFYRFAYIDYRSDPDSIVASVALCIATALTGTLWGLRNIFRESVAQALVPAIPQHTRTTILDSLPLLRRLSLTLRMSLRNLFRRPFQSGVTCLGLMLATALLVFARFEEYAIQQMLDQEYRISQRQSHSLIFSQRFPISSLKSVESFLGHGIAEASLVMPVSLKFGRSVRELTLVVKNQNEALRKIDVIPVKALNNHGLTLSKAVADKLGIVPPAKVLITTRDRFPVHVTAWITQLSENLMGTIVTVESDDFLMLFNTSASFNTLLYKSPNQKSLNANRRLSRIPALLGISEKDFEKRAFEKTIAENVGIFRNFMIGFALLIAMGVLYNNARIQFSEREREFALLRALGFFEAELTILFWTDFLLLTSVAIFPGLWLGKRLLMTLMDAIETEVFRIPVIISPQSYVWASAMLLCGVLLTALIIQPRIHQISFLGILKTRE
jgi:putative ABC transport system permease protein